jgi:cation transport ATPase
MTQDWPPETIDQLRREVLDLRAENARLRTELRRARGERDESEADDRRRRSPLRMVFWWPLGLAYLALVALVFSGMTGADFLRTLLAVLFGATVCATLAVAWLVRSSLSKQARPRQFSLGSLFFLTTFVAIYLAVVRWLVVEAMLSGRVQPNEAWMAFAAFAVVSLFVAALSAGILLRMTETLVWLAVWLVRLPRVRGWLSRRRARGK